MYKKIVFTVLLVLLMCGNIFAQDSWDDDEGAANRIALSFGLVGAALSYEMIFTPHFSVLAQAAYNTWLIADSLSFALIPRLYPGGRAFFLEMGFGYSYGYNALHEASEFVGHLILGMITFGLWFTSDSFQNFVDNDDGITRQGGFFLQPALGWNVGVGRWERFTMPISMGLDIRVANRNTVLPFFRMGVGFTF
ncbi:MAG: hypothetical protein FWC97_07180 [Treponema sp.]|nr:hypothetical protein [Treponema sp.]